MATDGKSKSSSGNKSMKKGKPKYLPHNRPVKKGSYPLRPGIQGFFITCDGGKERQASHEAVNVIDSFYEELLHGKESKNECAELPKRPLNTKTVFEYSDSSSSEDDDDGADDVRRKAEADIQEKEKPDSDTSGHPNGENSINEPSGSEKENDISPEKQIQQNNDGAEVATEKSEPQEGKAVEPPTKKQCLETNESKSAYVTNKKMEGKSVDQLIDAELAEFRDKNKRLFSYLDSGCNGVAFLQMRKRDGDPSPKDIVQHMMTSLASTKKHVSRFILRVLPIEITCYASQEEISRAIKPLIAQYFPLETQSPHKFAVLYDARANSGIDRMKMIDTVAKSIPPPHKVDLSNPDIYVVVQIAKTICMIGVVEKYKEFAKYNIRQLTSSKP